MVRDVRELMHGFESQQLSTEAQRSWKRWLGSNPSSLALRGAALLASRRKRLGSNPSSSALSRSAPCKPHEAMPGFESQQLSTEGQRLEAMAGFESQQLSAEEAH